MSESPPPAERALHRFTVMTYLLYLLGVVVGFTAVLGAGLLYLRRGSAAGTLYASHFEWLIRTFWWMLGATAVGAGLLYVAETAGNRPLGAIGAGLLLIAIFWFVYRILKGYMWLSAGEPVRGRKARAAANAPAER